MIYIIQTYMHICTRFTYSFENILKVNQEINVGTKNLYINKYIYIYKKQKTKWEPDPYSNVSI